MNGAQEMAMSNVVLSLHPGAEPVSWTEFCETHPRFSIALDGYVSGISRFDRHGPWLTLDHHADVDRLSARATCAQVLLSIRQGLFDTFRDKHGRRATVHANDCDEDVCLSWFLLQNPELGLLPSHTRLNRLVQAVDVLDTTAGASLHPLDRALMSELAWVFEPYREARMQGALDLPLADLQSRIIAAVSNRIREHLMDKGGMVTPDTRFQRIDGGKGWSMVREIGAQARAGMVEAGIRAYVSVRERVDGAWAYAVGRVSPFVPFNVLAILRELNAAEDSTRGSWGGGNLVGGSPRLHGSGLTPDDVSRIVGRVLARAHSQRQPEDSPALVA
jgi:hypothetical protein